MTDKTMREAFEAGFFHAGEGHNGEYVSPKYREPGALDRDLDEGYAEWKARWATGCGVMAEVVEEMQVAHIEHKGEDPIVMLLLNDEWYVLPVGCHRTLETAAWLDLSRCDDSDHGHYDA